MKIKIKSKYLVFPVNQRMPKKRVYITDGDKPAYALNIKLDNINPDFKAYVNVERYIGKHVELYSDEDIEISFTEADEMALDNLYKEPLRPQVHFTTKNGWLNDPNGLIFIDGIYHMFYQHNPCEPNWENMHWGHAVSTDFIHWEEKDMALFPDEFGTMYSGCAIIDENNLLGKNTKEHMAALLFYTHHTVYEQNIAYTNDGFKTFEQYELGTAVPHIADRNRDPKVVFCDELNCYIMALFLFDDMYTLLKSYNLKDWKELQRIKIAGDCECPDIFPINADDGNRKWVIMGACDKYIIGNFNQGCFTEEQSALSLHYGKSAYAGQTFSNLPNGRIVRMVWDKWDIYPERFNGQMGIPMEFGLSLCDGIYYLTTKPVEELNNIIENTSEFDSVKISPENKRVFDLSENAQLIKLKGEYKKSGILDMQIFGRKISLNFLKNQIVCDGSAAPISLEEEYFDITVLVDTCSFEIFTDKGRAYIANITQATVVDKNLKFLELKATEDITVEKLEINSLKSIWS